ncbi:MAG: fatty acid desaturase [Alcanivoracaceae bacterium]|jgi:fatty acid desaturase|nr:fatty acid desaturase [Alcanivoracaceae bacterium]
MDAVFRHRIDIIPVAIVIAVLCFQLWAITHLESLSSLLIAAATLLLFSACPGSISHNHHHCMTFRHGWMNRIYEVILFLETGIPPFAWTLHHNLGHHKHYLDPALDPSAWQQRDGTVMNRIKYDLYNALRVYPEIIRIGRQKPRLLRRFLLWAGVCTGLLAGLLWYAPIPTLLVIILPMPIMLVGLLDNTYQQHQGLDMRSEATASRNTTNRFYNLVSWNLGYHTAHHQHPSVHWSQLPALHERVRATIPDELVCDSVFLSACGKPRTATASLTPRRGKRALARAVSS